MPPKMNWVDTPKKSNAKTGKIAIRSKVERTRCGQPGQDVVEVFGGRRAGTNTRNEPAVLLHVVGDIGRVERDGDVEISRRKQ